MITKIKRLLPILLTAPLLLTNLQLMAENNVNLTQIVPLAESETVLEDTFVNNHPFSFYFVTLHSGSYSGGKLGFSYQPRKYTEYSGLLMDTSLEYLPDINYKLSSTEFESEFTNLRWSAGYQFDVTSDFNITPSLGVVTNIADLDSNTTQGYTNLKFTYEVTDSFSLFMEGIYDFGTDVLSDSGMVGIGFKYTPKYNQSPVTVTNKESTMIPDVKLKNSTVTGIVADIGLGNTVENVIEPSDYEKMLYTIQVGVFTNMASVNTFRQKNSINASETYTREYDGFVKMYYKGFDALSLAKQSLAKLRSTGVDGFVLNTPKQVNKAPAALNTYYTVQLGGFKSLNSAIPIINKVHELDKQAFIKQSIKLMKLYTGKFQNKSEAQAELKKLKENNIDGFVTKIN